VDTAVALVQSYLYMNGYFTVTEYPILELLDSGEFRTLTDADILALRFPGAGRVDPGGKMSGGVIECDPALDVADDRIDMIIGEVKEGRAELNTAARDPNVLHAVLHRFGAIEEDTLDHLTTSLLDDGEALHPSGLRVRLMAFGSRPPKQQPVPFSWMLLSQLGRFMHGVITDHWSAAQAIQSKDPALSFLLLLEKAVRGEE
jgi:hypothetical protein